MEECDLIMHLAVVTHFYICCKYYLYPYMTRTLFPVRTPLGGPAHESPGHWIQSSGGACFCGKVSIAMSLGHRNVHVVTL
jgi:hypothetical protein